MHRCELNWPALETARRGWNKQQLCLASLWDPVPMPPKAFAPTLDTHATQRT